MGLGGPPGKPTFTICGMKKPQKGEETCGWNGWKELFRWPEVVVVAERGCWWPRNGVGYSDCKI